MRSAATPLTVNAVPAVPAAPTASVTVQPTCAVPTGTIVITAPLGAFEYSLDGGAFQAAATTFTVSHRVHIMLPLVQQPILPASLQRHRLLLMQYQQCLLHRQLLSPCNRLALYRQERLLITAPLGAFDYSLDGGAFRSCYHIYTVVAPGAHNVTVRSTTDITCVSAATPLTVNAVPAVPAAPTASVTVQPTCAVPTGTIVITAPLGAFEYSLDGGAFQAAAPHLQCRSRSS